MSKCSTLIPRALGWTLITWALLLGIVYSLQDEFFKDSYFNSHAKIQSSLRGWLMVGLAVSLALVAGRPALAKERPRWFSILFWIPILPLAAYIIAQFSVHWALLAGAPSLSLLILGVAVPLGTVLWCAFQLRTSSPRRLFSELLNVSGAALLIALVSFCWMGVSRFQANRLLQKGEARWVEIGHPMAEYNAHPYQTQENEAFKILLTNLQPLGVGSLYKRKEGEPDLNQGQATALEEINYYSSPPPESDEVPPPKNALVVSIACKQELNALYKSILENSKPVWAIDETRGIEMRVPAFLALRKLSQLAVGDSLQRLHDGDIEGAALASNSMLRMNENCREQPLLVSVMINCAIETLFAKITARLPEEPNAWELLAQKAKSFRGGFQKTIQSEAAQTEKALGNLDAAYSLSNPNEDCKAAVGHILASTLGKLNGTLKKQVGEAIWMEAEMFYILGKDIDFTQGDLNAQAIANIIDQCPDNWFAPNIIRGLRRINCMLILLEQAEMIRFSRARMKEGVLQAKHASVVAPGLVWEMTGNADTRSATIKLSSVPPWLANTDVTGTGFYLLPFDGSQSWSFRN